MIQQLENVDPNKSELYGEKILWLKKLFDAGLKISDSIIITNEFFLEFIPDKRLDEKKIKDILHSVKDKLSNPTRLFFKISTCKPNFGLDDNVVANATLKDIKLKLEEIYHTWFSDSSIAYRITHSIEPINTYPALILQAYHNKISSLVTRCPQNGFVTDQQNLENVHNNVAVFTTYHLKMLRRIENSLAFPVKVFFVQKGSKVSESYICDLKPELMCNDAWFVTLSDLLRKKLITEQEFLAQIKPNMISSLGEWKPFLVTQEESLRFKGVPNSKGRVIGRIAFTTTNFDEGFNHILCVRYMKPDDVHCLVQSVGAIGSEGGATSHLGVAASQFGIPAVVGVHELDIDPINKYIRVGTQYFPEGRYISIDSYSGEVVLSHYPIHGYVVPEYTHNLAPDNLNQLYHLLLKFTSDDETFREFSVDFQTHLSTLIQQFKKIGFGKGN